MDYEEYKEKKKAEREGATNNNAATEQGVISDNDDLPFWLQKNEALQSP